MTRQTSITPPAVRRALGHRAHGEPIARSRADKLAPPAMRRALGTKTSAQVREKLQRRAAGEHAPFTSPTQQKFYDWMLAEMTKALSRPVAKQRGKIALERRAVKKGSRPARLSEVELKEVSGVRSAANNVNGWAVIE